MGSNKFGQLGLGDFKPRTGPCVVGGEMVGKRIVQAACGDDFTVVATSGIFVSLDKKLYSFLYFSSQVYILWFKSILALRTLPTFVTAHTFCAS